MENNKSKKITIATVKSFIRKNFNNLYIKIINEFDSMIDGTSYNYNSEFKKVSQNIEYYFNLFSNSTKNYCEKFENNEFIGYEVGNCCYDFIIAIKK